MLTDPGYGGRLAARRDPDRVTQLRSGLADSTVATAVMRLLSNRKVQLVLNGGFGLVLLGVAFFSVRHFMGGGWPIHHADPLLVSCAAALFLVAYAFKAWGWQRLFQVSERPTADALAFAGGAACAGSPSTRTARRRRGRPGSSSRSPGVSAGSRSSCFSTRCRCPAPTCSLLHSSSRPRRRRPCRSRRQELRRRRARAPRFWR